MYKEYTNQDIINNARYVKSIAGLLRKLKLKPVGGNYYTMKKYLQLLNVDTSHWTGQGWNKSQRLKDWKDYKRTSDLKKHVINDRGHKCERCYLSDWMGEDIILELHHIDGNRANNEELNLQLLCPNCHSLTKTWRNRRH